MIKKCQQKKKRHLIQQRVKFMKTFKQFNKDEDVKDFEEDLVPVKTNNDEKEEKKIEEKE